MIQKSSADKPGKSQITWEYTINGHQCQDNTDVEAI